MPYDIESMQRWSNDPRTMALHQLLHRTRVELVVRTFHPGLPSRPARYRSEACSEAFDLGFSDGWRDQKPSPSYDAAQIGCRFQLTDKILVLTKAAVAAYAAGFRQGRRESDQEIKRICARPSLAPRKA